MNKACKNNDIKIYQYNMLTLVYKRVDNLNKICYNNNIRQLNKKRVQNKMCKQQLNTTVNHNTV